MDSLSGDNQCSPEFFFPKLGQTSVSKSKGLTRDAVAQFSKDWMSNKKLTYLFLLDQFENFHEVSDHKIHFDAPLHKLRQLVQVRLTISKILPNLFVIKHHVHLIHQDLKSVHGFVRVLS